MLKSPKDVLKKSYLKEKPAKDESSKFVDALELLKSEIVYEESEEYNKNLLPLFFKSIGYDEYKINTKGRIDLAIYNKDNIPEVIIEAKAPKNKAEMITHDNFNKKAFYEALLYFLQEIHIEHNYDIRHVIITNMYEWYIFDAAEFNKIASNKKIKKFYIDTEIKKRSLFKNNDDKYDTFKRILESEKVLQNLDYVRFNLKDDFNKTFIGHLQKLLSPRHLLKQYVESDSNTLNTKFYDELLYILGLEETTGNKKLIQRISPSKRSYGSLIENTIRKLETETECKHRDNELELFEIALGLNITWLNRILFLKLLEAKLLSIHNGDYPHFLSFETVREFDNLNTLFFEVLAIDMPERKAIFIDDFKNVPYLNSALFETTELECDYLRISNLKDNAKIKVLSTSVLTQHRTEELNTLEYLLKFLSAYDFATDSGAEFKNEHGLINASVLGLIFEKLNGYKDGSFYTPSFITMYMTRQTIRQSVVAKFNEVFKDEHIVFDNFNELKNYCDVNYFKEAFIHRANKILDSITIVDPAVGSGHFLVSALNELLVIKNELKVLRGLNAYNVTNENDELYIEDKEGVFFEYRFGASGKIDKESQEVQKALFHEKQKIIENQLFGVDINPNSAQITRLRLWIELLKHSYYDESGVFVTMPNIDINIKAGNSLISRYDLHDEIDIPNIKHDIERYKSIVQEYKEGAFSVTKDAIRSVIDDLKEKFKLSLKAEWHEIKKQKELLAKYIREYGFNELTDELSLLAVKEGYRPQGTLFGDDDETISKAKAKKREKLLLKLTEVTKEIDDKLNGKIYEDAFEWRFEFPEVLDEEGNFVGFDVVIGNPPYFNIDTFGAGSPMLKYFPEHYSEIYMDKSDILFYFIKLATDISREQTAFIISNAMLFSDKARKLRNYILNNEPIEKVINFEQYQVFDEASIVSMMIFFNKQHQGNTKVLNFKEKTYYREELIAKIDNDENYFNVSFQPNSPFALIDETIESINRKIDATHPRLGDLFHVGSGMQTGANKVFTFKDYEISEYGDEYFKCKMSGDIIEKYIHKPTEEFLLYLEDEVVFDDLPESLREYLLTHKEKLSGRAEIKRNRHREWWKYTFPMHKDYYHLPKIWTSYRAKENTFCLDRSDEYIGLTNTTVIFGTNENLDLRYVLALLNSKLLDFRYRSIGKQTGNGVFEYFENQISKLPIPTIDVMLQQPFIEITDAIIFLKKQNQDTTDLEAQIDQMVYELYRLSEEEIAVVEGRDTDMQKEEIEYNTAMEDA